MLSLPVSNKNERMWRERRDSTLSLSFECFDREWRPKPHLCSGSVWHHFRKADIISRVPVRTRNPRWRNNALRMCDQRAPILDMGCQHIANATGCKHPEQRSNCDSLGGGGTGPEALAGKRIQPIRAALDWILAGAGQQSKFDQIWKDRCPGRPYGYQFARQFIPLDYLQKNC